MNNIGGNFYTRTFGEIFGDFDTFYEDYTTCGIPVLLSHQNITTLFYLLYARYGNSHIASENENQFKYKVFSTIFMYGPTWEKRLEVQGKLRELTDEDIVLGSEATYNHAFSPNSAPSTNSREGLPYINDQNKALYTKGKLEGYANLMALLETDVTEKFIGRFKKLFLTFVEPYSPLWYKSIQEEIIQ